jgi:short-subunit dehydrogenase
MNKKIKNWNGLNVWLIGASDGIGAALARNLLKRGVKLTVSSRRKEKLDEVVSGFTNVKIKVLDVLDLEALKNTMEEMENCDLVIYMAADYSPMTSDKIDPIKAARIIDVNFKGAVNVSSIAISYFVRKGYGHLSLVASIAGLIGLPQSSVYGATKAALINLGESLYHDLKPLGLDVSIVNPGFVKTRLTEKNNFEMPFIMTPEEAAEQIVKGYESGKFSITFPFLFSLFFRTIRVLPYSLHFKLLKALVKT